MGDTAGDCVELASLDDKIGIRDSKNPHEGHLTIPRNTLRNLVRQIKTGGLDH
ncbi:DUF397 domain-containing protein [Actinomadura sp. 1N219]|uniref:DUF397 domain-containing protein n=1 Tax=Actinomadura sp. 1N219 TaxID=3375152 RepID=UPI0037A72580